MKKVLVLAIVAVALAMPVAAATHAGSMKVGAVLGTPSTGTFGIGIGDSTELNVFAGYDYISSYYGGLYAGANYLFNIVDINIEGQSFPLSLGPQAAVVIGGFGYMGLDVLADVRWEYSFAQIPLNLFIEAGLGIRVSFANYGALPPIRLSGASGIGVRYIIK